MNPEEAIAIIKNGESCMSCKWGARTPDICNNDFCGFKEAVETLAKFVEEHKDAD